VIVAGVAALGQAQSASSRRAAEARRLDETLRQVSRNAGFYSSQLDPQRLTNVIGVAPWALDGTGTDQLFVKIATESAGAGPGTVAILAAPDGRILTAAPAGIHLPIAPASAPWRTVVEGRSILVANLVEPDLARSYFFAPIVRDGRTAAVFVYGTANRSASHQVLLDTLGATGDGSGWSLLDARGAVFGSWNPDLIGRRLVEPTSLTPVSERASAVVDGPPDQLVIAARVPSLSIDEPSYLVFSTPTDRFYRDLRTGQAARDASLVAVVVTALAGLTLVNHRREQAARRGRQRLDALLQHTHDIVVVLADDGRTRFVSSAIGPLLGHDPGDDLLGLVHPDDRPRLLTGLDTARADGNDTVADIRVGHAEGDHRWFDIDAADHRHHREIAGILLTCHEITERKAVADRLAFQAGHDPLTRLPNRGWFAARLRELSTQRGTAPYAVLFVDLDHFKPVNDTLGHDAGDHVLVAVGERLRQAIREGGEDRAPDLICRLGGDEFAILLVDVDETRAQLVADRILTAVERPIAWHDATVRVGATIGIALSDPLTDHPDTIVRNADFAMYQAKEAGRGRYAVFVPT
jgi:diguanylate cyclase (GGDEF)-like protein/PAS domain S-box-containing protein